MKFYEIMQYNKTPGEIGLEIETEANKSYTIPENIVTYWNVQEDHSLRNHGLEYTFRKPYDYQSKYYLTALEVFAEMAKSVKFEHSVYSSVHVHFNMLDREVSSIFSFIMLYFLFEEVLTDYCGVDRNGNLFCLKTGNAEDNLKNVLHLIDSWEKGILGPAIRGLSLNQMKYASLNLAVLRNLGSVEIRTHGGCTDINLIDRWVGILYRLYELSRTVRPDNVLALIRGYETDYTGLINYVFKSHAQYLDKSNLKSKFKYPAWYASEIGSATDWKAVGETKLKPKRKFVKANAVADITYGEAVGVANINAVQNLFGTAPAETTTYTFIEEDF